MEIQKTPWLVESVPVLMDRTWPTECAQFSAALVRILSDWRQSRIVGTVGRGTPAHEDFSALESSEAPAPGFLQLFYGERALSLAGDTDANFDVDSPPEVNLFNHSERTWPWM